MQAPDSHEITFKIQRRDGQWQLRGQYGRVMIYFGQHPSMRAVLKQIEILVQVSFVQEADATVGGPSDA